MRDRSSGRGNGKSARYYAPLTSGKRRRTISRRETTRAFHSPRRESSATSDTLMPRKRHRYLRNRRSREMVSLLGGCCVRFRGKRVTGESLLICSISLFIEKKKDFVPSEKRHFAPASPYIQRVVYSSENKAPQKILTTHFSHVLFSNTSSSSCGERETLSKNFIFSALCMHTPPRTPRLYLLLNKEKCSTN